MKLRCFYFNLPVLRFSLMVLMATPMLSEAVIVAGANGGADNLNNTTQLQLENVSGVSDGHFLNNVFRLGGGNGVYIGYRNTESGSVGYALSGVHLGNITSVTIDSLTYTASRTSIDGSDLALYTITRVDNMMPSLQAIQLANAPISNGTSVVMVGEGRSRIQNATTDANTSDAVAVTDGIGYMTSSTRELRWGTNNASSFGPDPNNMIATGAIEGRNTDVFRTVFDQPSSGEWLSSNQAQGVIGDSGGGVFAFDGSLLGIMVAIQGPDANQARFGNTTLIADIATYKPLIDTETGGVLIPEPGSILLMSVFLGCFAGICGLRKRQKHQ